MTIPLSVYVCKLNIIINFSFKLGVILSKNYKGSEINFTAKVICDSPIKKDLKKGQCNQNWQVI